MHARKPKMLNSRAAMLRHLDAELTTMNQHADKQRRLTHQPGRRPKSFGIVESRGQRFPSLTDAQWIVVIIAVTGLLALLLVS